MCNIEPGMSAWLLTSLSHKKSLNLLQPQTHALQTCMWHKSQHNFNINTSAWKYQQYIKWEKKKNTLHIYRFFIFNTHKNNVAGHSSSHSLSFLTDKDLHSPAVLEFAFFLQYLSSKPRAVHSSSRPRHNLNIPKYPWFLNYRVASKSASVLNHKSIHTTTWMNP